VSNLVILDAAVFDRLYLEEKQTDAQTNGQTYRQAERQTNAFENPTPANYSRQQHVAVQPSNAICAMAQTY